MKELPSFFQGGDAVKKRWLFTAGVVNTAHTTFYDKSTSMHIVHQLANKR
jgi:hypothetical protein